MSWSPDVPSGRWWWCVVSAWAGWVERGWSWLPALQEAWWTGVAVWRYSIHRFSAMWTWLHVTSFWTQIFCSFCFQVYVFSCIFWQVINLQGRNSAEEVLPCRLSVHNFPLDASLCFCTPSSKGGEIVSLLDLSLASLSLPLLTPNKAEFEKTEVRNGNICHDVKPDTTV